MIPLGTVCYFTGCREMADFNGRTVEIVGHELDQDGIAWHVLDAAWLREEFGERDVTAQACNLQPITGPTKREKLEGAPA